MAESAKASRSQKNQHALSVSEYFPLEIAIPETFSYTL
jgi:hypothetical protein